MQPRERSHEAQQRQLLLQQIAQKRAQQQSQQAQPPGYESLEDSPGGAICLDDSTDDEQVENKPPPPPSNQTDKSGTGLSRLKRNCEPPRMGDASTKSAMEEMMGSVSRLTLASAGNSNSRGAAGASTGRQVLGPGGTATHAVYAGALAEAAATKLPSDDSSGDDDGGQDSDPSFDGEGQEEEEEISDSEEEEGSEEDEEDSGSEEEEEEEVKEVASVPAPQQPGSAPVASDGLGDLVLEGKTPQQQFVLPAALHKKLYPHQIEGLRWLWSLQLQQRGGILGDDMGLGKTMQCSAFVAGLLHSKLAKRVMVVAPKTLLLHWQNELAVCGLGRRTHNYYGDSVTERDHALRAAAGSRGGVLLTTYGMVLHNADKLSTSPRRNEDFAWDVVILDEGHKVKNPKMKLVQELRKLPAGIIVIISGTPIQNNLAELHALFDLCCEGLLGDHRSFKAVYERHITAGQDRGASARQREVGSAVAVQLRRVIAPFFLRREKKDVLGNSGSSASTAQPSSSFSEAGAAGPSSSSSGGGEGGQARPMMLSHKNDLVVWLRLQPLQRSVYTAFLHSDTVKGALNETDSALAALTVLKKICDHPALLSDAAAKSVIAGGDRWAKQGQRKDRSRHPDSSDESCHTSDSESGGEEEAEEEGGGAAAVAQLLPALGGDVRRQVADELRVKGADSSCKTVFVLALLEELAAKGHRTLVFSQSRVMLDILQAAVVARRMSFCRIDGTVSSAEDRQAQVKKFQRPGADIPVFLLTSQVGGLGLTLTAADRVVIVDPSWNPAVDNQAVDRAYRIGQTRDVVVYRLITCGTVEEKIYRKQVFKGGLSRAGTEEGVQFRYFTQQQLRDLFTVTEEGLENSTTQQQLHDLHAQQRQASDEFNQHLEFLETMKGFAGISDHDLLFTSKLSEQGMSAAQGATLVGELEQQAAREAHRGPRKAGTTSTITGGGGASGLSDMFSSSLNLGSGGGLGGHQAARVARGAQQRRVDELQQRLDSCTTTLNSLAARVGDGGGKLLKLRETLVAELAVEVAKLNALDLQQQQGTTTTTAPSSLPGTTTTTGASTAAPPVATDPFRPKDQWGSGSSAVAGSWGSGRAADSSHPSGSGTGSAAAGPGAGSWGAGGSSTSQWGQSGQAGRQQDAAWRQFGTTAGPALDARPPAAPHLPAQQQQLPAAPGPYAKPPTPTAPQAPPATSGYAKPPTPTAPQALPSPALAATSVATGSAAAGPGAGSWGAGGSSTSQWGQSGQAGRQQDAAWRQFGTTAGPALDARPPAAPHLPAQQQQLPAAPGPYAKPPTPTAPQAPPATSGYAKPPTPTAPQALPSPALAATSVATGSAAAGPGAGSWGAGGSSTSQWGQSGQAGRQQDAAWRQFGTTAGPALDARPPAAPHLPAQQQQLPAAPGPYAKPPTPTAPQAPPATSGYAKPPTPTAPQALPSPALAATSVAPTPSPQPLSAPGSAATAITTPGSGDAVSTGSGQRGLRLSYGNARRLQPGSGSGSQAGSAARGGGEQGGRGEAGRGGEQVSRGEGGRGGEQGGRGGAGRGVRRVVVTALHRCRGLSSQLTRQWLRGTMTWRTVTSRR